MRLRNSCLRVINNSLTNTWPVSGVLLLQQEICARLPGYDENIIFIAQCQCDVFMFVLVHATKVVKKTKQKKKLSPYLLFFNALI